jgi:hypothetical protein
MSTSRNAGYAFVGETTEDLANRVAALYWATIDPPPIFQLPLSVPTPGGPVKLTGTLAIPSPRMTFAPDPDNRIQVTITVVGEVQAVSRNSVVQSQSLELDATGRISVTVDTSTDKFVPVLDFASATLDGLALSGQPDLPQEIKDALNSEVVRNTLQSVLRAQKPLVVSPGLAPDSYQQVGIEIQVVDVAVVPLLGVLAVAADVKGYTTGDPSKLVNLFTTPAPIGAGRFYNQSFGPTERPGGKLVAHSGNVALTVNGDMLLSFLNGPVSEKLKQLVWEKEWGGPAPLPGPLVNEPFRCQRTVLGHQGSLRQLDCLGVDDSGTIKVLWVLDQGEWQGNVAIGDPNYPAGSVIAVGNQQSLDQLTALVIDNTGTISVLWERATSAWHNPVAIEMTQGNFTPGGPIAMGNQGSLDQLTALAIDKQGTMQVLWVRDTGAWQGPIAIGPQTKFSVGGFVAVANQGSLNHLTALSVDANGTIQVLWVDGSGAWQGPVPIANSTGKFPAGAPIAMANQGSLNQVTALVVDRNGTVNVLWVNHGGEWQGPVPITSTSGLASPGGSIAVANQGSLKQLTAVFVDHTGTVQVLWVVGSGNWQGPVQISTSGFTSALAPVSIANQGSMDQITALVADNNHAVNAFWVIGSGNWQGPAPLRVQGRLHSRQAGFGYQQIVFTPGGDLPPYRDQLDALTVDDGGTLFILFVNGTEPWHNPVPLTGSNFAPPGASIAAANQGSPSNLTALIVSDKGAVNVLWVRGTGNWQGPIEISSKGFAHAGAPIAVGNQGSLDQLTALVIDNHGTMQVFWVRDAGAWQGPIAIGPPSKFSVGGSVALANQGSLNQLTALSVDVNGTIQVLWVDGSGAWQGPVPIANSTGKFPAGAPIAMTNQGSLDEVTAVVVDNSGAVNVLWVTGLGEWQGPIAITPSGFASPGASIALQNQISKNQLSAFLVDSTGALSVLWVINKDSWEGPVPITGTNFAMPGAQVSVALQNPGTSDEFLDVFLQNGAGELVEFWIQNYGITAGPLTATISDISFRFGTFNKPLHPTAWPGLIVEVTASASEFSGTITIGFDVILDSLGDGDTAWLSRNKGIQGWSFAADYVNISLGWQDYLIAAVVGQLLTIVIPIQLVAVSFLALFDGIVPSLLAGFEADAQKAINEGLNENSSFGTKWDYKMPIPLPKTTTTLSLTNDDCAISQDGLDYFGDLE